MKTAYDIFNLKEKLFGKVLRIIDGVAYQYADKIWIYKKLETFIPDGVYAIDGLKVGVIHKENIDYFSEPELDGEVKLFWIHTELLKKFTKFTSTDELRPSMNCVAITENKIAATDAHKLIWQDFKFDDNVLIPANVIKLLPKKEYISFEVYDKFVKINLDGYYIIYQKMNEKFPDYKSVIPQQFTSTLKFDVSKIEWCKHEYVSEFMTFTQKGNTLHVESLDINTDRKYVQDIPNTNEDLEFKVVIKNFKICVEGLKEVEIKMYKHLILINGNILCDTLIND